MASESVETLCALDYRYGRDVMKALFTEQARLEFYLVVEAALAGAQAKLGLIPAEHATAITEAARSGRVTAERVARIEDEIRHDIMAIVKALAEQCEPQEAGGSIHFGATSNDIIDTANGLQFKAGIELLDQGVERLIAAFCKQARAHKLTPMLGRTHAQWAVPTTFGLKMAVYALEMGRHGHRLRELTPRLATGKLLGVVGTGASLHPHALEVQTQVMKDLGLNEPLATTQILQRDRIAELVLWGANVAASLEKFTTEVRNLQRSELAEAHEGFDRARQVGSSTMPHKRNPIASENVGGLARMVRALVTPALENCVQWHERDLTNSSAERLLIPHFFVLLDDLLHKSAAIFENLYVDSDRMAANLAAARGLNLAEAVMMALARKGMDRQRAHELVRQAAMTVEAEAANASASHAASDTSPTRTLGDVLAENGEVTALLSQEELEAALDPANYLGHAGELVDRAVKKLGNKKAARKLQEEALDLFEAKGLDYEIERTSELKELSDRMN